MEETKLTRRQKVSLIAGFVRPVWGCFAAALLFSALSMVFNALTPQVIKIVIDSVIGSEPASLPAWASALIVLDGLRLEPVRALWLAAAAVGVIALMRGVCGYGLRVFGARGSEGFVKGLRDRLFGHIQRLPYSWHTANQTGDIIQRCTSDVDVIRTFACNQLMEVVRTVFLIILYLFIMFRMNVRLSLVSAVFVPVVFFSSMIFYKKISARFKDADEAEGELTTAAQENLTGVRVVRAFGRERFETDRFNVKNERFSALWIHLGKLLSVYWASGTLLTSLQVMVVIVAGVYETVSGELTLGEFLTFVTYNASLAWPVRSLGRVLADMSKAGVSMDRVGYILSAEEEHDAPNASEPPLDGDIVFDHVSFGYEGCDVLHDVSFTVKSGMTFAVLGGTGSGKSTLVHLLDRLFDVEDGHGRISIGGVNINEIKREHLRRGIGLVLQEPFLFSRTIRENIVTARPGSDDGIMRRMAGIACVDDAITEFPDGYDTLVGERGVTLSGGQKQRVAIARMLIQQAPIMVFDDSLSAVDTQTDAKIRAALKNALGSSTVILISHRITTLMQADQILVLEDGRVSDIGTHAELISRPGIYKEIFDIQMCGDDRRLLAEGGETDARI